MEWLVGNQNQHSMIESLGTQMGDRYNVSQNRQAILDDILTKLSLEDRTLRTFRRTVGFSHILQKDLIPLLNNVKDDRKVIDTTIRIMANLTTPVECLLPVEVMSKTDAGRNTIMELKWLLYSCKDLFLDHKTTRRIIDHIEDILEKGDKMTQDDCQTINDSVLLLRNILHIPETRPNPAGSSSSQNKILWNLFAQNIDKVLIDLMTIKNREHWRLAIVQLVALMYKDQHVATLQKLLSVWFEATVLSESSEDDESNTSPPGPGSGGDSSSSLVTSDRTSDSSDNSGSDQKNGENFPKIHKSGHQNNKKNMTPNRKQVNKPPTSAKPHANTRGRSVDKTDHKMECGSSELSDCGYVTQLEGQEVFSTSSNDCDSFNRCMKPVHQKPGNMLQKSRYSNGKPVLTLQEKEEIKRKKLNRRSRKNMMNMKAFLHHTPTDEDITHLLKEFTVDFLLKGFSTLVIDLKDHIIKTSSAIIIDTSHFFWLVTYFLKFAVELELDLEHISPVLSYDIASFMTFEGVGLCEQLELAKQQSDCDITPILRRLHLLVTAIGEFIQAINSYKKMKHMKEEHKQYLSKVQKQVAECEELRCLFVMLLRQFSPSVHSKQYLQDLIVTNHVLLSFVETSLTNSSQILFNHMRQFVAVDMMRQYAYLLECFQENGQYVNDCIFTMLHHVAGDLENVNSLFQPSILKVFSQIWESDSQLCEDWSDLIEYVIRKFVSSPRVIQVPPEKKDVTEPAFQKHHAHGWPQEDSDCLYWYFVQSANSGDPIGDVMTLYYESGVINKTRIGVIGQLLKQDVINGSQYNEFMKNEPITIIEREPRQHVEVEIADEIDLLREQLMKEDKHLFVIWIQRVLLEACHAKLTIINKLDRPVDPVSHYCTMLQEAIPVVAWNCEQSAIMQSQVFLLLLHKLGLLLPADAGKVFARIPEFWTPDLLYSLARKLGPLQRDWIKFSLEELGAEDYDEFDMVRRDNLQLPTKSSCRIINLRPTITDKIREECLVRLAVIL